MPERVECEVVVLQKARYINTLTYLPTYLPANVTVAGSSVTVNCVLKSLAVTLDSTLTFDDHVNNVV